MLYTMMKDTCRICARDLCGNQRRWIFHTASKLNLQVLLSHVLGKEVTRDGKAEFACSKCAFMLDRIYRFDTVIARIEALSIERLQKLLLEKDRLKLCVANLYKKNNEDLCSENKGREGTVDISNLPDAQYAALLQEDFTYSGFESWTEHDEQIAVPTHCQAADGIGSRPKRCHCCTVLRVPDANYEAICKVPRKVARSISCIPSTRYSASVLNEELHEPSLVDVKLDKTHIERESIERISSSSSVESLLAALETSQMNKEDEIVKGTREDPKCDFCNDGSSAESCLTQSNTLDMALTLVKTFDYRPVQIHKGSRIPIKSSPPKSASITIDESSLPNELTAEEGFLSVMFQPFPRTIQTFIPELADLQDLYEDVYEDYMPLRFQISHEKLHQTSSKLSAANEVCQKHDCTIQRLKETISSKTTKDLRAALHQLQAQLQEAHEQLHTVQVQNNNVIQEQQLTIERQNQALLQKEHLLQDHIYLLQFQEGQVKGQGIKDPMLEKLQERIRERDKALERAVDEKYSAVEEREGKLHQLQLSLREKEHDLQQLRNVQSRNEETINSMNSTLKLKDLEIQQISTALKHLQLLKQEMEVKYNRSSKEREGFIEQLQTSLHERHKELEIIATSWLSQTPHKNNEMVEKLQLCLQSKEKMLQGLLRERNHQAVEHEKEIQALLKTESPRILAAEVASENRAWTLEDGSFNYRECEQFSLKDTGLEDFAGEKGVPSLNQTDELSRLRALLEQKEEIITELMDRETDHSKMMVIVKNNDRENQKGNHELQKELEKELANVKEEFELVSRKEREAKMELSSLLTLVTKQNEDLQVQAADVESLTRSVQIKEELIKDLQVQLVNPEEVPVVESLTQEVLKLREKVTILELQGQDCFGNRSQELVLMLEKLVAERCTLNKALQSERLLYSKLLNSHSHPKSCEERKTLQSELEAVRVLRGRLEEALEQSLQQLSNPEAESRAPIDFGGKNTEDEGNDDESDEFSDSIEEDAEMMDTSLLQTDLHSSAEPCEHNPGSAKGMNSVPRNSLGSTSRLKQEESPGVKRELRRKKEGEEEEPKRPFKESKARGVEAEIAPVDISSNTLQHLHLEVKELKEPIGEAMSGWCGNEMEKVKQDGGLKEDGLRAEIRRLHGKMRYADRIIHLLKEQLVLNSKAGEMKFNPELIVSMAKEIERLKAEKVSIPMKRSALEGKFREDTAKRHCSRPSPLDIGDLLGQSYIQEEPFSYKFINQLDASSQKSFRQHVEASLREQAEQLLAELVNNQQQNRELQNKLVVSEATVTAQADQLKQYQILLSEPLVRHDSKQVQVDIQDLGYETCGRSENEADREETTSPDCDEQEDLVREASMVEELNSHLTLWETTMTSTPKSSTKKFKPQSEKEQIESGNPEDVTVLLQNVKDLKKQLERSERVIWSLKCNKHSFFTSSDCVGSMERLYGVTQDMMLQDSSGHSMTDEDEEWHSDDLRTIYHSSVQSNKYLQQLTERVSLLEDQLQTSKQDMDPPHQLKSSTWSGKYDSLIQAQARELSLLRLKIREGKGVCKILSHHLGDIVKSFEELLRMNDIDYYMGQSFRDQLSQGNQLAEKLNSRLSSKDRCDVDDNSGLSNELCQKDTMIEGLQSKLQGQSLTPSSSCAVSESDPSDRTSFVSDDQVSTNGDFEACSDTDAASEYRQYQESGPKAQSCGTSGHHFNPITCSGSISGGPYADHTSFLALRPGLPHLGPGSSGTPGFSLGEVQQELLMLQKQLGESIPLTTPVVKPAQVPGTFFDTSSSFFPFAPSCSLHISHNDPALNCSAAQLNQSGGNRVQGSSTLRDMPHLIRPPTSNIFEDSSLWSSGYQSAPMITGNTGNDLLEEHLTEIRYLRKKLEESICTNKRLGEQLEQRLKSSIKENEHFKELERMREVLLSSRSRLKNMEFELEQERSETKKLLESVKEKQQEILQLKQEHLSSQESNTRLQHKAIIFEQQLNEKQQLLQSVQSELKVYEMLYATSKRVLSDTIPSPPVRDVGMHSQPIFFSSSVFPSSPSSVAVSQGSLFDEVQENCYKDKLLQNTPSVLEGDAPDGSFANKNGRHVIGHIDDYSALKQQVQEARGLIPKMESLMQLSFNIPFLEIHGTKALDYGNIRQLFSITKMLHKILEESAALLTMFWRAALPSTQSITQQKREDQSKKEEILALQSKLAEQEKVLQNTVERLRSTSQMKEDMEEFIVGQLTRTHDVLRKARTNLEANSSATQQSSIAMIHLPPRS
ncbi:myomegalin isoform X2 [Lissotriton helveticus]